MEGVELVGWASGFSSWIIGLASTAFRDVWHLFTIQNLATVVTTCIAIWKWWEAREANLFLRFERMICKCKPAHAWIDREVLEGTVVGCLHR